MNSKRKQLRERLKNTHFRSQYIDAHVDEGIAFQIRSLRNKRGESQPEFAQKLGVKQPLVSAWENPNYGNYSLNTLKKLAKAFDVGLLVRFVPFSTMIDWTVNLKPENITPPNFNEEQELIRGQELAEYSELYNAFHKDTSNLLLSTTEDSNIESIYQKRKPKIPVKEPPYA